jgi:hypothetical protein
MSDSKPKYGYNPEPRLSANQLSDYLNATPPRRKSIIREAKYPKTSVVARYNGAREGLTGYLCDAGRSPAALAQAIIKLQDKEAKFSATDWTKQDCNLSIEAIQTFQKSYNSLGLSKIDCKPVVTKQPKLSISGVDVSVSLDATTRRVGKSGGECVGGLILLFAKSDASSKSREARCRTSAILAAIFTEQHLAYLGEPDAKISFALDVFGGRIFAAPSMYPTKLEHMKASCEEVALRWPTIDPPADYDG